MIATLSEPPGEIERFRANPWEFQRTFRTPLKDLKNFVATALSQFTLEAGALTTYEIVFEPDTLLELMTSNSIHVENRWKFILRAGGQQSIAEMLEATLACWIDFAFVPTPEFFAIYADHDEYTTFYARNDSTLRNLGSRLELAGFEPVNGYERPCGDCWK
jgi:hypothetical protein